MVDAGLEKKRDFNWTGVVVIVAFTFVLSFGFPGVIFLLIPILSYLPLGIFFHELWRDAILYGSIMGLSWGAFSGVLGLIFVFIRGYPDKARFVLWCLGTSAFLHFLVETTLFVWPSLF